MFRLQLKARAPLRPCALMQAEAAPLSLLHNIEMCKEELLAVQECQAQGEELREEVGCLM